MNLKITDPQRETGQYISRNSFQLLVILSNSADETVHVGKLIICQKRGHWLVLVRTFLSNVPCREKK